MLIDKKGRLFGMVNVIDLLILLVLLAVIVFGIVKVAGPKGEKAVSGGETTVVMQYYAEEVSDFVTEKVKIGDPLKDDGKNLSLGKITNIELAPSRTYGINSEGQTVLGSKDQFKSVLITAEVPAKMTEFGSEINGNLYGIGHTLTLRAGIVKIFGRVYSLQVKG